MTNIYVNCSYGVVLWELLTGKTPYEGFNFAAILYGVGNNTLKLPIPDSCPDSFKELLQSWHFMMFNVCITCSIKDNKDLDKQLFFYKCKKNTF